MVIVNEPLGGTTEVNRGAVTKTGRFADMSPDGVTTQALAEPFLLAVESPGAKDFETTVD